MRGFSEGGAVGMWAVEEVEVICARRVLDEHLQLSKGRWHGDVYGG